MLCGVSVYGGTYSAEGIIKLSDALKVNATLTSLRCAIQLTCPIWKVSAAADTIAVSYTHLTLPTILLV